MESGSEHSGVASSRDSEHARRMKEEAQEEQTKGEERKRQEAAHIDTAAERVLQLEQIATLDFSGLGIRARGHAEKLSSVQCRIASTTGRTMSTLGVGPTLRASR